MLSIPYEKTKKNTAHVQFDYEREERLGLPEAVFCEGKNKDIIQSLLLEFNESTGKSILFTRLAPEIFYGFPETIQKTSIIMNCPEPPSLSPCLPIKPARK